MKKKLAIFDFDGTLYSTTTANYRAYAKALEKHGIDLDPDYFSAICYGRHYKAFLPEIMIRADEETIEKVHQEKTEAYLDFLDEIEENTVLFDLLDALRPAYHIALASTSSRRSMEIVLERFGRTDAFDLIVAQEDVRKKKPAPDCFLLAMKHFDVKPEDTVIFEDSGTGITAAEASGASYLIAPRF